MPKISNLPSQSAAPSLAAFIPIVEDGQTRRISLDLLRGSPFVRPESFGAVGNGEADDTSPLQECINASAGKVLYLDGHYRVTSTILIPHGIEVLGPYSAVVEIDADDATVIRVTEDALNVAIRGPIIRGNSTGLGGYVTGNTGGHGIAIDGAARIKISDCIFENIGIPDPEHGNYASPIAGVGVSDVTVEQCFFDASCRNRTGADITLTGTDISVQNANRSRSYCDAFVSLGAEGTNVRHIVKGNFAYRAADAISRSGVLYQYDGASPAFADISHNQIEGFVWHGVYGTAQVASEGGGVIVAHNTIRYCGGGSADLDADTGSWPGSAVKTGGAGGALVHGNSIFGAGYTSEGDARTLTSAGLLIYTGGEFSTRNVIATDNIIRGSSGSGLAIVAAGTSGGISNINVAGNLIEGNEGVGIEIAAQSASIECITDVNVRDNKVRVKNDVRGISLIGANGGWSNRVWIDENDVSHANPPGSGDVAGIYRDGYSDYTRHTGSVCRNTVKGFRTGVSVPSTVNLYSPFAVRVADNVVEDANIGVGLGSGSVYWGIHEGTIGRNVTTMQTSRTRSGRILGPYGSGRVAVEIYQVNLINAVPPDGAWIVGDRVYMAAKAGPITGYECITAGSTGTWKPIYSYGLGGSTVTCRATPIVGSTTLAVEGMSAWSATGTPTSASYANTNRYTRMSRVEYLDTSAGTDSVAGIQNQDLCWLLNTPFYVRFQFGLATGVSISTGRAFCGLAASTSAPTDVEPSTLINMIGMGWDSADSNVSLMHNDGSGTAVKVDLGATFPVPTTDGTQAYTLEMVSMGSGTGVQVAVTNETTGVLIRASYNTEIPNGGTTPLAPQIWSSVGGTSGVTGIAFAGFYGERQC